MNTELRAKQINKIIASWVNTAQSIKDDGLRLEEYKRIVKKQKQMEAELYAKSKPN